MVRLVAYRGRWYWLGTAGWTLWFVTPLATGWLAGRVFGRLQAGGATARFWFLLGCLLAAYVATALLIRVAHVIYMQGVESAKGLMRVNTVDAQLASGGPGAGPRSVPVGDILVRLRDDPFDMVFLLDNWIDLFGLLLYSAGTVAVLSRIDPWATAAGVGPMVAVGVANRFVGNLARRYRARARESASAVSDFLTAAISASLTVKVAGAQRDVLRRLDTLNERRAGTAVLDQTWNEVLWTANTAMADLFVGLALVVAARGGLDTGEIALFATLLTGMVWVPMRISALVVGRRRYQVSAGRMDALLPEPDPTRPDPMTEHRQLPILGGGPATGPRRPGRIPLERLDLRDVTVAGRGVDGVDLTIERGQLVVVAGPVGSGKTSLLRAVVGLLPLDRGEVCWNDRPVGDRAAFFVPPQCAFVAQVPRLFAESLADNLRLGHAVGDDELAAAIALAAFDDDVAEFPEGLDTRIGARGVRLSGGQAQRAAAARALAPRPELLVLDDLTSALDAETEQALWDRLAAAGFTVLAASNRPVALARADRVVRLA
ncbi:MAG: ABC transporter ATP-binding protein/permease [Acidimicrobiia bacterium]|nr:ABC transporter ATP-binding protein/permease [Acidimicrobiia bacterium]MDH5288468.1 ABC transporter ATP-binding protein/permease [Acidimicrobiia bacterium]